MLFKVTLGLAACCFALLAWAPTATAVCCSEDANGECADGEPPGKGFNIYCGKRGGGGCNVFGCNCGGGCITANKRSGRSANDVHTGSSKTGFDVVRAADTDGNGALDHVEIVVYFSRQGRTLGDRDWRALDTNQDGKLTPHEIDSDLGPVAA